METRILFELEERGLDTIIFIGLVALEEVSSAMKKKKTWIIGLFKQCALIPKGIIKARCLR